MSTDQIMLDLYNAVLGPEGLQCAPDTCPQDDLTCICRAATNAILELERLASMRRDQVDEAVAEATKEVFKESLQ